MVTRRWNKPGALLSPLHFQFGRLSDMHEVVHILLAATVFSKVSLAIVSPLPHLRNFTFAAVLRFARSQERANRILKVRTKTFISFAMVASPK